MNKNKEIGILAENLICAYVLNKGWKVIERNSRRKSDEIDIIAIDDNKTLIFCEVKSLIKKTEEGFMPEDNLSPTKLRKITRLCQFFAREHGNLINEEKGWRIDLFAVDLGNDGSLIEIRHYENI